MELPEKEKILMKIEKAQDSLAYAAPELVDDLQEYISQLFDELDKLERPYQAYVMLLHCDRKGI